MPKFKTKDVTPVRQEDKMYAAKIRCMLQKLSDFVKRGFPLSSADS